MLNYFFKNFKFALPPQMVWTMLVMKCHNPPSLKDLALEARI